MTIPQEDVAIPPTSQRHGAEVSTYFVGPALECRQFLETLPAGMLVILSVREWKDRPQSARIESKPPSMHATRDVVVFARLTAREREVVHAVSEGLSNEQVASRLYITPMTVKKHLTHIFRKLQLRSRAQLIHLMLSDRA